MTAASGLRHCDLNDLWSSRTAVERPSNRSWSQLPFEEIKW